MASRHRRERGVALALSALLLLGSLVYLGVLALGGQRLVGVRLSPNVVARTHDPRGWLILAFAAALVSLLGWALAERARARAEALSAGLRSGEESARAAEHEAREGRRRAEERASELEREGGQEREQQQRYAQAWERERRWNRQLREQLTDLQQRYGILGHPDLHAMILELTVDLVDATKGVLLSRREDSDGELKVVAAVGFEHDPADSALAQRFARQVLKHGETVREDHSPEMREHRHSAADAEVDNLLAIPIYLREDFHGVIVCANREEGFAELDDEVLLAVGDHAGAVLQNAHLHGELRRAYLQTVRALSSVIEVKDPDLRGHSEAVADYVVSVAQKLDFEPRRVEELLFGGLLHDIGKIGISERILLKPAALTPEEFSVMQLHPRIGYHLIRQIPALAAIAPAILHHHERFDGSGYPGGLRGEAIPIESRIIAVADAFSAMITKRPYKSAITAADGCAELERCAGSQFDPHVVALFTEEVRRRPLEELAEDPLPPDPELEVHRQPGSFVLGGGSFGIVDSLTMLHSHRHFHETAQAEARRASLQKIPFAVVTARLDEVGRINIEQGYAAGDAALQNFADTFSRAAGRIGARAFRVSGSRMGLIASGLDQGAAEALVQTMAQELHGAPHGDFGLAVWRPGESAEDTIARALSAIRPGPLAIAPAG